MKIDSSSSLQRLLGSLVLLALLGGGGLRADLNSDLAFTAFSNVDLNALAGGQILQERGGLIEFQRGITTQTLYVIDAVPAAVQDKMIRWNPASHPELKVWINRPAPLKPTPADFSGLNDLPDNRSINNMVSSLYSFDPGSPQVQLNQQEGALVATGHGQPQSKAFVVNTWSQILSGRINEFLYGDAAAASYSVPGGTIHPVNEIKSLLHSDPKVLRQFQGLLLQTPLGGAGKLTPADVYYESFDVEGTATLGAGADYVQNLGTSTQVADLEFYLSTGIYVSVEIEQLWPVTINGRNETLVWRGDMVSTENVAYLHGTERLASGMMMIQDVKGAIQAFRSEFK